MGTFDELSHDDFEELVADLFSADTGLRFVPGGRGQDRNIDMRAEDEDGVHVIQCKHYPNSTYSHLKAAARDEARALADRQDEFASYRFVTSRRVTHENRREIAAILSGLASRDDDVVGEKGLRQLLRQHPEVERAHHKLWLAGAAQLDHFLHAETYERTWALVADSRKLERRFVKTEAYAEAKRTLEEHRCCVISGDPGAGKTSIAQMLLLDALDDGWKVFRIPHGKFGEAWRLSGIDPTARQLFYFDDFLGQVEPTSNRPDDETVTSFMRQVAASPNRRLVMTSREYVLRRAQRRSDELEHEPLLSSRMVLSKASLTEGERAEILASHIRCSDELDGDAAESVLTDGAIQRIVNHPNYNPRLVAWMTGLAAYRLTDADRAAFADFCVEILDDPEQIWQRAFEVGLDEAEQILVVTLASFGMDTFSSELEIAFDEACKVHGIDTRRRLYERSLAVLDDSFATTTTFGRSLGVKPADPSVIDFVASYLRASRADAELTIRSTVFVMQYVNLWELLSGERPEPDERLVPLFAEALARIAEATASSGHYPWADVPYAEPTHELSALLEECAQAPGLSEAVDAALPALSESWKQWVLGGESMGLEELAVYERLAAAGALDRDETGRAFLSIVERFCPKQRRQEGCWHAVARLRSIAPGCLSDDEWDERRAALGAALEAAVARLLRRECSDFASLAAARGHFGAFGEVHAWRVAVMELDPSLEPLLEKARRHLLRYLSEDPGNHLMNRRGIATDEDVHDDSDDSVGSFV